MGALIDLTGSTYGRLTVVERADSHVTPGGHRKARWLCRCTCGTTCFVRANDLRSGHTRSCGCLYREHSAVMGRSNRIEKPGYQAAHNRVYVTRGPATDHPCVDCGGPAQDWSYDHTDPGELVGTITSKGNPITVAYSPDPQHYQPRCQPCHRRFDKGR